MNTLGKLRVNAPAKREMMRGWCKATALQVAQGISRQTHCSHGDFVDNSRPGLLGFELAAMRAEIHSTFTIR